MSASTLTAAMLLATAPANTADMAAIPLAPAGAHTAAINAEAFQQSPKPEEPLISPVASAASAETIAAPEAASTQIDASLLPEDTEKEPSTTEPAPDLEETAIVVTGAAAPPREDPLMKINAQTYEVIQSVDKALIRPVALAYKGTIPKPVRHGLSNFLNNVFEPVVFVNFLLQLHVGKAAETLGRFTINTTLGVAGLIDVAKKKPFNLPRRSNGFADTMGYYGIKPGAFLFLPLLGPTTVRDAIGGTLDKLLLPATVGSPFNQLTYTIPTGSLSALGERADFDEQLKIIREESGDPYTAARKYYLEHRQAEIDVLRGKRASVDSPLYETAKEAAPPPISSPPPEAALPAPEIAP